MSTPQAGKHYLLAEHSDSYNSSLALADTSQDIYLYQADCLDLMDKILAKHPNGVFDTILPIHHTFFLTTALLVALAKSVSE